MKQYMGFRNKRIEEGGGGIKEVEKWDGVEHGLLQ